MLKYTLANKVSLFAGITPEDRANYIRTADFEAFMEAVESKDRETQLAYSKVLRTDTQLNMNTSAPSMVINISEVRGLLQDVLPTIDAEFTEIPASPQTSPNNDKIEEETFN
jgi:tRNA(Leu) C34 or U34 (ribose-2'-O)-methylase TrmL